MHVFHYLAWVMFCIEGVHREDLVRVQIHKMQTTVPVKFRHITSTDKTYVVCKYAYFITSSGIYQALLVSDRLYIKCQNTSGFGWSKSSL